MRICICFLFLSSIFHFSVFGQSTIEATLIDSTSQSSIPYATITFNNTYGVISNEQGQFLLNIDKTIEQTDSLHISCLGYESKSLSIAEVTDSIYIDPKIFELHEIAVNSKKYTVDEIITLAKEQLSENYDSDYTKKTLFYRQSQFTKIPTSKITIEKTSIPEFNQEFIDSIVGAIPKESDDYVEILGTMYGKTDDEDPQKLDIIKAAHLYDKNNEITFESFEERINAIIKDNVKKDSYFKIKSGIFGTKEEMDTTYYNSLEAKESAELLEEQKKREKEEKENFLKYKKRSINNLELSSFVFEDTGLNTILEKSNRFEFELLDYAFLNNNYVYMVSFKPKRKEDYKGVLYINPIDFAIERIDFQNVKPLKKFSLLGLSYSFHLNRGTLVYEQNTNQKYMLKFAEIEQGFKSGIKRPLKIIEKNKHVKGKRKQNEIASNIHFEISTIFKRELVVFENESISKSTYDEFEENANVKPTYLPDYDPEFWKGYNVIEPNQAIKEFKSVD